MTPAHTHASWRDAGRALYLEARALLATKTKTQTLNDLAQANPDFFARLLTWRTSECHLPPPYVLERTGDAVTFRPASTSAAGSVFHIPGSTSIYKLREAIHSQVRERWVTALNGLPSICCTSEDSQADAKQFMTFCLHTAPGKVLRNGWQAMLDLPALDAALEAFDLSPEPASIKLAGRYLGMTNLTDLQFVEAHQDILTQYAEDAGMGGLRALRDIFGSQFPRLAGLIDRQGPPLSDLLADCSARYTFAPLFRALQTPEMAPAAQREEAACRLLERLNACAREARALPPETVILQHGAFSGDGGGPALIVAARLFAENPKVYKANALADHLPTILWSNLPLASKQNTLRATIEQAYLANRPGPHLDRDLGIQFKQGEVLLRDDNEWFVAGDLSVSLSDGQLQVQFHYGLAITSSAQDLLLEGAVAEINEKLSSRPFGVFAYLPTRMAVDLYLQTSYARERHLQQKDDTTRITPEFAHKLAKLAIRHRASELLSEALQRLRHDPSAQLTLLKSIDPRQLIEGGGDTFIQPINAYCDCAPLELLAMAIERENAPAFVALSRLSQFDGLNETTLQSLRDKYEVSMLASKQGDAFMESLRLHCATEAAEQAYLPLPRSRPGLSRRSPL